MKKTFYFICTIASLEAYQQPNRNTLNTGFIPKGVIVIQPNDVDTDTKYLPNWDSLDKRPLPEWYDRAKVGIFLHWGVFSVPSFHSEWFWRYWEDSKDTIVDFMKKNYPPNFTYQDFGPMFTAEFFDPDEWATLFKNSGAKYIVLTTKHHEGFTLFPSKRSFSWNAMDVGPGRDLVGDLSRAVRDQGIKFGVYHSLFEWFNPIYKEDSDNKFTTQHFTDHKLWPDLKQLVNDYHPSVIWSDGDAGPAEYWKSEEFLAWLYNESPVKEDIVVNDRWGTNTSCKHGGFYSCADRYNPGVLQPHKWENAFTVDKKSWGYRRDIELSQVLTTGSLIKEMASTVSCGGNVLINVGPTKEGTITPIFQERLLELGQWLSINGEGIYNTSPWFHQNDTINGDVWYTCTKEMYNSTHPTAKPKKQDKISAIYAVILKWPSNNSLQVKDIAAKIRTGRWQIEMLGNEGAYLKSKINNDGTVSIKFPDLSTVTSKTAWTLRFKLKQS